jgi:tripartite-type tricarboxylate transporter receptor subunit TctC
MTYGTAGAGTTPHLSAERIFRLEGKADIPHAPYTGAGPATQAVIGSHIPLASVAMSAAVQNVQAGQVKGLAVTSKDRVKSLPDVPTAREQGFGEADDTTWVAFLVLAKTPDAVIQKINADVNAILKDKDTQDQLEKIAFMAVGGTTQQADAYVRAETERWGDIIRKLGLEKQ